MDSIDVEPLYLPELGPFGNYLVFIVSPDYGLVVVKLPHPRQHFIAIT